MPPHGGKAALQTVKQPSESDTALETMMTKKLEPRRLTFLSLIIPVYNEAETLHYLREQLEQWMPSLEGRSVEVILVNDGSKDTSLEQLAQWAEECSYAKVLSFSRNFGHQAAVSAGLQYAKGEAAVIIDADLQDPLEVINEMVARYEDGYDIAYGQRVVREGETRFKRLTAWLFYRIMQACIPIKMPADTGDFRLVSRACIDAVNALPERQRFLRGLFAWVGFNQTAVPYQRKMRRYGSTKYPLKKMLSFAWNGITSFSVMPVRVITVLGLFCATLGIFVGIYALLCHASGATIQGWTSLMCLIAFLGGVILVALGIIGEYIVKIYEEIKARPVFIVQSTYNIEK